MNIGLFTDTYFPQVSGVATSIKTLRDDLERKGHHVYIFTTTDPNVEKDSVEPNVFRFGSVPFISFTDRRIAIRGLFQALEVAKELDLDIVHTQTEFSMGWIGKFVAKSLKIPAVHTYHTMYEDYLHYVLNGKLLKPYHVKQFSRAYLSHMDGAIAPSEKVLTTLRHYGVTIPIAVIPTGVDFSLFHTEGSVSVDKLRAQYHLTAQTPVILTLSRIAAEKRIDRIIRALPALLARVPEVKFLIVGDGPEMEELQELVQQVGVAKAVIFIGEIQHDEVVPFYQLAQVFVSASDTEAQGLTYIEAMAAGTKCVVRGGDYTRSLFDDPAIGTTFDTAEQMVQQLATYLEHPHAFDDDEPRLAKMAAISADNFGQHVCTFYEQAIRNYEVPQDDFKLSKKTGEIK